MTEIPFTHSGPLTRSDLFKFQLIYRVQQTN